MTEPIVSILIPVYNEAADIRETLRAACEVRYARREIVVIDDASTDETPAIVADFARLGVRLIRQDKNRGVAAARNVGMRAANGEIVVILNADVRLPSDFIERILPHYEHGADYLVVQSRVSNTYILYPRYIQAMHEYEYRDNRIVQWTEGYSCRREAALAIGGFPEEIPGASGEDAIFGDAMAARFVKAWDPKIVVTHVAPETLNEYWRQRVGRGRGSAFRVFGFEKRPLSHIRMVRAWIGLCILVGTLAPVLLYAARLTAYTPRGWRDWLPFAWAHILDRVGWQVGYWRGFVELRRRAQV